MLMLLAAPADPLALPDKLIAEGAFQRALDSLSSQPQSARGHLLASKAYDGLGNSAKAVELAEAALALEPRSEAAHLQLGQIFLTHNTPLAAAEVFTEALSIHPDSFLLRLGRGLAFKDLTRNTEAEADLRYCVARKPDFPIAFDALATVYLHTRRFEDLQRLASIYSVRNPSDFRGPYYAAAALDGLESDAQPIERLLAASIGMNPRFAAAHALLGKILLGTAQTAAAILELETALRLRPDYTPAALHLAQALRKAGRAAEAAKAFGRVRELKEQEQTPRPTLLYHRGKK